MSSKIFHSDFINEPYWWQSYRPSAGELVDVPESIPVAIVGGGYAGLSTALELAKQGIASVVLEAQELGYGASTRNAGGVSGGINVGRRLSGRPMKYAPGEREAILADSALAFSFLEGLIQDEGIQCDWNVPGRFIGAWTPAHYAKQAKQVEVLNAAAYSGAYMVPPENQREEIDSDYYFGGQVIERSALVNPALLYQGVLQACQNRGVTICAKAPVLEIKRTGSAWLLKTGRGVIKAEKVVIATNGYTGGLTPQFKRRLIPIASHAIVTEELPAGLADAVLPKNRLINDTLRIRSYYRLTPDRKRLLFGGRGRFGEADARTNSMALHRFMVQRLPQLADTKISYAWSGNTAFTFDATPHMGSLDNMYYLLGCNGSGVAMMSYLGFQLARKIANVPDYECSLERDLPGSPFYRGNPWFLPFIGNWFRVLDRAERSLL